ncbi:MAG TPA: hypothetical protein VFM16_07845, partial [Holophagaceae bacterium]|nr:hypothetical protein [Holophagaceae bacterium]
ARWELEDKIRELQWKLRQEEGPDMIDKIVGLAGGPEGVSGLISAVVGALNRKPAAGARPGAPPPPPRARLAPSPGAVKVPQAPAPASSSAGREPSRAEHVEAMAKLGEALSLLEEFEEENPGADASIPQAIDLLHQAQEAGMADGPLASWWAAWESNLGPMVDHILKTAEEPVMDLNGLKALLIQRLDEGASDEAIIAEARSVLTPEQQAEWLPMLKAMPKVFLGGLLGVPHHQERLAQLVDGLTA